MTKWLVLALLLLAAFAYMDRDRLYVRDPLGSVTRAGVPEDGAQVFVSYRRDVLLENDHPPMYLNLIQHDQPVSGPDSLKCIHFLVCLTDSVTVPPREVLEDVHLESMTPDRVQFKDAQGRQVVIQLH